MFRKSTPRFTKSPSLVLIRLALTEIQRFKSVKINKENVWHPDAVSDSVRVAIHFFFWHFQMAVSCLLLGLFTPNLGICKTWCALYDYVDPALVANPIIYRLAPSPSRFENRQWCICYVVGKIRLYCFSTELQRKPTILCLFKPKLPTR